MRKRSCPPPSASPSAVCSAAACGAGSRSSRPSAGRSSWWSAANGSSDSDSTPRALSTCMSPARARASSSRTVLPTPASPRSASAPLRESRAASSSAPMRARSASLPNSTSRPYRRSWRRCRRFTRCDGTGATAGSQPCRPTPSPTPGAGRPSPSSPSPSSSSGSTTRSSTSPSRACRRSSTLHRRRCSGSSTRTCSCSPACCSRWARSAIASGASSPCKPASRCSAAPASPSCSSILPNGLIAVRAAMGVGGALIMPATLSIISNVFPREERAKAIGIWSGMASLGIGLGPLMGGLLLEWFDWTSVFLLNVPVALVALVAGAVLVPESRDPEPGAFDFPGAILSIAALTSLVYGVIEAPEQGLDQPDDPRLLRLLPGPRRRVRALGAADHAPDAEPGVLPQPALQHRVRRHQPRVLLAVRLDLRAHAVHAGRQGLLGARGRRGDDPARRSGS